MKTAYLIDEGILLMEKDKEFSHYTTVYDKRYGYYDDNQYYAPDLDKAVAHAKEYVNENMGNVYVVVSATQLRDDFDFVNENSLQDENYLASDVVYSIARINGKVIENFIEK